MIFMNHGLEKYFTSNLKGSIYTSHLKGYGYYIDIIIIFIHFSFKPKEEICFPSHS